MGKQLLGNWYNTNRRFSLCSHCTPVGLNTRNGLKDVPLINGTTRRKLGNESTEDFATFLRGSFVEGRGDEIEVETWIDVGGKNGTRRDWIIRDRYTKEIIAKATSMWAIMNRETRRLSKMPEEVRQELDPFYFNKFAIATEEIDQQKIQKLTDATAEGFRFGVTSVPRKMLEDYKMTSMILEFRRECTHSDILESMTSASAKVIGASNNKYVSRKPNLQFIHLLRLQDNKTELVRARTEWNLKQNHT
ncbi:hypothetical protein VIGAN_02225000 [Vigna angularis var. angularis]|uniref:Acyl-[acyl-carrier-protein] hydrolase n=1 Tax=Vigna angularis var. angularis TaxID=157739 RepID=A0A0S3RFV9_PHAAN|nr:hypothetical protein VIGAN_02225000 [Vigna angularis var. angularis]